MVSVTDDTFTAELEPLDEPLDEPPAGLLPDAELPDDEEEQAAAASTAAVPATANRARPRLMEVIMMEEFLVFSENCSGHV
jgi:hypothetical protein